jgi:hypothetical protein
MLHDDDALNEIQYLVISGTTIGLSNGGGSFSINDADDQVFYCYCHS